MSDHQWYGEIDALLGSSSHLFLHYGALHRVDEDGAAITQELGETGWAAERIVLRSGRGWMPSNDTEVAVIVGMESLRSTPRALENLRVEVNGWVAQRSAKIVIVSHVPDLLTRWETAVRWSWIAEMSTYMSADWPNGLHRNTKSRLSIRIASRHDPKPWPVIEARKRLKIQPSRDRIHFLDIACQAIYELGSSYVAWLDEMVLESELLEVFVSLTCPNGCRRNCLLAV